MAAQDPILTKDKTMKQQVFLNTLYNSQILLLK